MSTVYEKLGSGQTAFTSESREGDYVITQALGAREPTALEIRATIVQYRANYARPAANTTLTYDNGAGSDVTAYFVDDVDFQDRDGGLQSWTRIWATIPANYMEPGGTIAFTFPAYTTPIAFGSPTTPTGAYTYQNHIAINIASSGITAGDSAFLDLNYVRSNQNYHVSTWAYCYSGDVATIEIGNVLPGVGVFSGLTGTIREGSLGRTTPETLEVDAFIEHTFALANETTIDNIMPSVVQFSPVNSSGYQVDTLSTGTATFPNSATYSSMIAAGTLICARQSERTLYMGNIWERKTLLVKAR